MLITEKALQHFYEKHFARLLDLLLDLCTIHESIVLHLLLSCLLLFYP